MYKGVCGNKKQEGEGGREGGRVGGRGGGGETVLISLWYLLCNTTEK